jgi:hypothetical protein
MANPNPGNPGVDSTPESQMSHFSDDALPTALIDLRNKHGYVNEVIQYCETAYLSNDKKEIEVGRERGVGWELGTGGCLGVIFVF